MFLARSSRSQFPDVLCPIHFSIDHILLFVFPLSILGEILESVIRLESVQTQYRIGRQALGFGGGTLLYETEFVPEDGECMGGCIGNDHLLVLVEPSR